MPALMKKRKQYTRLAKRNRYVRPVPCSACLGTGKEQPRQGLAEPKVKARDERCAVCNKKVTIEHYCYGCHIYVHWKCSAKPGGDMPTGPHHWAAHLDRSNQ